MHIILGANGHIGSALSEDLLKRDEAVMVVLHSEQKQHDWEQKGARVAVADVHDTDALRQIFRQGERLFLLNPPASPKTDTAVEERKTVNSILAALDGSGLKKVVANSTYGAQPGERVGDLSVLYEMEQALASQPIPATILRPAYYMSNWDMALQTAQQEGVVPTFYPPDFKIAMVAPSDIGRFAAQLITEPIENTGLRNFEGPAVYSPTGVANAFETALKKPVQAVQTPREQWLDALAKMGFSELAAQSFATMTQVTLESGSDFPQSPTRGTTTLQQYISDLVQKSG